MHGILNVLVADDGSASRQLETQASMALVQCAKPCSSFCAFCLIEELGWIPWDHDTEFDFRAQSPGKEKTYVALR